MSPTQADPLTSSRRVLTPSERISEVLFGLIMVMTFTGSLSIADAGREDVRAMLIGALGCNLAWGIIDAVLYLMSSLADKGRSLMTFRAVRKAADPERAQRIIGAALPSVVAGVLEPAELRAIHERLTRLPEPPDYVRLDRSDWLGAAGVFLLVFLATFPTAIPFMVMKDATLALRVSNGIAVVMLLGLGYAFGRCLGGRPWIYAVAMVILGGALAGLTILLGG